MKLIEAALFIASRPLSIDELSNLCNSPREEVLKELRKLKKRYEDSAIEIVYNDEEAWMRLRDEYLKKVSHLAFKSQISRPVLRTLALIAKLQPIKRSEIAKMRGGRAYEHIKRLEELGLVKSEKKGRTVILRTTKRFELYFGKLEI